MINFDKFLASFITEMKKYSPITSYNIPGCIKKALKDQGLDYKNGEIVKVQCRISAEEKEAGHDESEYEEIVKLADKYYDKVLIKECDMEEKEAHHCRISYIHGAKAMLEKQGQKSTWSEEDENCLSTIIAEFSKCAGKSVSKDEWMRCNDFLNSLRDRVYPKQEWGEDDEYTLNETIQHLKLLIEIDKAKHCACDVQYYQRDIDWLKTIKQRIGE